MNIKQEIDQLGESIHEIVTSAAAVKGEDFAQAVGIHFESTQLMEVIGRIGSLADEEYKEYASQLVNVSMEILSSIACKACPDLSVEQFNESSDLAQKLYERRNRTIEAIRNRHDAEGNE